MEFKKNGTIKKEIFWGGENKSKQSAIEETDLTLLSKQRKVQTGTSGRQLYPAIRWKKRKEKK